MKTFNDIAIGQLFIMGGTVWRKRSTRTGELYDSSQWFYFSKGESVKEWYKDESVKGGF